CCAGWVLHGLRSEWGDHSDSRCLVLGLRGAIMATDYFDWNLALNELTGSTVPGAIAQVYAIDDTEFTTPLTITDMTDVPLATLTASPTGLYPPFKVTSGQTQVIVKSGDVITPVTSLLGALLGVIPDPS